jgi:hypothetical protein
VAAGVPGANCDTPRAGGLAVQPFSRLPWITGQSHKGRGSVTDRDGRNGGSQVLSDVGGILRRPAPQPSAGLSGSTGPPYDAVMSRMERRDSRDVIPNPFPVLHELGRFRGTLETLIFLYYEESSTKYRMRQRLLVRQVALDGALSNLLRLHLVASDVAPRFPYAQSYRLTGRGRTLAESPLTSWSRVLTE